MPCPQVGDYQADPQLAAACQGDISMHCKAVAEAGGRVHDCLRQHWELLRQAMESWLWQRCLHSTSLCCAQPGTRGTVLLGSQLPQPEPPPLNDGLPTHQACVGQHAVGSHLAPPCADPVNPHPAGMAAALAVGTRRGS